MARAKERAAAPWPLWILLLPIGAACIRGAVQPIIKLGLARWPDPIAAATTVGLCNGLAVLCMYAALGHGPVIFVAPLVATYPLITLLFAAVCGASAQDLQTATGVIATVAGIVLKLIAK